MFLLSLSKAEPDCFFLLKIKEKNAADPVKKYIKKVAVQGRVLVKGEILAIEKFIWRKSKKEVPKNTLKKEIIELATE